MHIMGSSGAGVKGHSLQAAFSFHAATKQVEMLVVAYELNSNSKLLKFGFEVENPQDILGRLPSSS